MPVGPIESDVVIPGRPSTPARRYRADSWLERTPVRKQSYVWSHPEAEAHRQADDATPPRIGDPNSAFAARRPPVEANRLVHTESQNRNTSGTFAVRW